MAEINFWLSIFQMLLASAFSLPNSKYLKTKVLLQSNRCIGQYTSSSFLTKKRQTKISCSSLCTATADCRRFMYNVESRLCSLFTTGENCRVLQGESTESYVCYRQRFVCEESNCSRCPIGFYGNWCEKTIKDCPEGKELGVTPSAQILSFIQPSSSSPPFEVLCRFQIGSTVIFVRDIYCRSIDFNRSWSDYEEGFGDVLGDFWIGLQRMREILLTYSTFELVIKIKFDGFFESFTYNNIQLTNSTDLYRIYLNASVGNPTDPEKEALIGSYSINGRQFSTFDKDSTSHDCPSRFQGGWWFVDDSICSEVNVNGRKNKAKSEGNWGWKYNSSMENDLSYIRIRLMRK